MVIATEELVESIDFGIGGFFAGLCFEKIPIVVPPAATAIGAGRIEIAGADINGTTGDRFSAGSKAGFMAIKGQVMGGQLSFEFVFIERAAVHAYVNVVH